MHKSLRVLAIAATLSALLVGCNGVNSVTPATSTSTASPSASPTPFTPVTTTLAVAANSPGTFSAPSAGGYTPTLTLPGLSSALSAPVTTGNTVPTGVATFSAYGPVAQSVISEQSKPSNGTTLLYISVKPNVATTISSGGTFGVSLALPSVPSSSVAYYLAFYNGSSWSTSLVTTPGTVSGSTVSWSNISITTSITLSAGTTYALALYSVPSNATPSPSSLSATATPSSSATTTAVTGQSVPSAAPVPATVTTSKKLPVPTATPSTGGTATPTLSTADKKTQGAVAATLSGLKSQKNASRGSKTTRKGSSLFRRIAQGAFRHKQDVTTPTCSDGLVETITTNSDGSTQVEDVTYADTACATTVQSDATFNYQPADSNGTVTAIGGTLNYASDGVTVNDYDITNTTIYNALATDGSYNSVSSVSHYPNASSTTVPTGVDYLATLIDASGNETDSSVSFTYDLVDGYEVGSVFTGSAAAGTTDSSGNVTTTVTGSSQLYNDSTYALAVDAFPLAAGATTWTVDGGSVVADTTSTQTTVADVNGNPVSDSQTTTDATNDVQIQFTSSTSGYTGTITQISTGATLGTMTTDQDGNGTITYADGSTGTITQFGIGT